MMRTEPSKHMEAVLSRMYTRHSFFAYLLFTLTQMRFVSGDDDHGVPTAATNGGTVIFNEDFMGKLSIEHAMGVVVHEVMHIILDHINLSKQYLERGVGPDGKYVFSPQIANIAMDYVGNAMITECGITLPNIALLDAREFPSRMHWVEAYLKLLESAPEEGPDGQKGPPDKEGHASHEGWGEPEEGEGQGSGYTPAPSTTKIERSLKGAQMTAQSMGQGNLPACIERLIEQWTTPQVDWKEVVSSTIVANKGSGDHTWSKPHRRRLVMPPGVYLPSVTGHRAGTVAVYGDTSGSVQDSDWQAYFGEMAAIAEMLNPEACYIGCCDTVATEPYLIESADDLRSWKPVGGGGTHMPAIFDKIDECGIVPDVVVVLTDGYTDFGVAPSYEVVWVMTTDVVAPYGKTVRIKT